jgi:TRAP-type uncharacterized transport system substrate-binding protein
VGEFAGAADDSSALQEVAQDMQALSNFTVPYHSGAIQFYKEMKVWGAKQEARTKEICS